MTKLVFFHQKRRDLGHRTGIEINNELLLQTFSSGDEPKDSALIWYLDVRFTIDEVVEGSPESARKLFLSQSIPIQMELRQSAEELRAGIDPDLWPIRRPIAGLGPAFQGELVFSAMKRFGPGEISAVLLDTARDLNKIVEALEPLVEPAY